MPREQDYVAPKHTQRNYRGSQEPGGDIDMVANRERERTTNMQRETIHKAVAAFITSVVTLLVSVGVIMPEWVTETGIENVSWAAALIISLLGGSIIGGAVYATNNKPRGPGEGPLGG